MELPVTAVMMAMTGCGEAPTPTHRYVPPGIWEPEYGARRISEIKANRDPVPRIPQGEARPWEAASGKPSLQPR
jgi:hypothetical protein